MLDAHAQKIGLILASVLAVAGSVMDAAQAHLGLVALILSILVSIVLIINGAFAMCHAMHQHNKDVREEREQIAKEKKALEDLVCEERRRTGICPRSTFKVEVHK